METKTYGLKGFGKKPMITPLIMTLIANVRLSF
jgi:hypothetical protein